jgi:hypothetical protein
MPPLVSELVFVDASLAKLGARGISATEAEQLLRNRHEIRPNSERGGRKSERIRLIGQTDGGRRLTLVLEPTLDPTTWLTVTGWES